MSDTPTLEHEGYEMKVRATGRTKEDAWGNLLTVLCEACSGKNERCEGEWPDYIDMNEGRIDCVPITEASNIELQLAEVTKQRDAANEAIVRLRDRFRDLYKNAERLRAIADAAGNIEACQELAGDYSCYINAAGECNIELDKLALAATKGGGK